MRRAAALLAYLPPGAAIHRGTDAEWTHETHMLANIIDMFSGEDSKPIERPAAAKKRRDQMRDRAARHEQRRRHREGA